MAGEIYLEISLRDTKTAEIPAAVPSQRPGNLDWKWNATRLSSNGKYGLAGDDQDIRVRGV